MSGELNSRISSIGCLLAITIISLYLIVPSAKSQQTFEEFISQQDQEYERYLEKENEAFEQYVRDVEKKWNEFKHSTKRDWYEYSRDLNTLSQVDFEQGEVVIVTLVEKDSENLMDRAKENISDKIIGLFEVDSLTQNVILENHLQQ